MAACAGVEAPHVRVLQVVAVVAAEFLQRLGHIGIAPEVDQQLQGEGPPRPRGHGRPGGRGPGPQARDRADKWIQAQ